MKTPFPAVVALALLAVFSVPAFAGGKGDAHKSEHAQSEHAQTGGEAHGGTSGASNAHHGDTASLAKGGNAAHASLQGLLHAAPGSEVGLLRAYADANAAALADQGIVDAFRAAHPDYAGLTETDIAALDGGQHYLDALAALSAEQGAADAAFAATGADPTARGYVDGLLGDYYAYLAAL